MLIDEMVVSKILRQQAFDSFRLIDINVLTRHCSQLIVQIGSGCLQLAEL